MNESYGNFIFFSLNFNERTYSKTDDGNTAG